MSDLSVNRIEINRACSLNGDFGYHTFEYISIEALVAEHLTEDTLDLSIRVVHAVTGLRTARLASAPPVHMAVFPVADYSAVPPSADTAENHAVK